MACIMAIDYGTKRCGVAVTDPLQTCAFGLDTVPPDKLISFIKSYTTVEKVSTLVVGEPKQRDNTPSEVETKIAAFLIKLKHEFPLLDIVRHDERFTSKMVQQALIQSGAPKKVRQKKEVIDKLSATLILQGYLDQHQRI
ncbi:MAG: Holliday junction resolvase RuvX [Bacteroidetes bacterium]|nr:Holliday junction resolvase RuvX [Bacteroidota bacterium]MDA1085015.1 Holliday junction resolvase RuvX [Bacteroidota bacterium]